MTLLVQLGISLSYFVVIFFIGCQVDYFIGNYGICGILFINDSVRSLYKSVFVYTGIAGQ